MKNNNREGDLNLEMSVVARARAQLSNMLYNSTHRSVPHGGNIKKTVLYISILVSQKMLNCYLFSFLFFVWFVCLFVFFSEGISR